MKRALRIATSTFLFALCAACSHDRDPANEPIEVRQPVSQTRITSAALDRSGAAVVSTDSENATTPADRDLIDQLRTAVIADDTISTTSKEVWIIARNGVVTLSGLVKNVREHDAILDKARALAGNNRVVDEIEVESP